MKLYFRQILFILPLILVLGCARELDQCSGPLLDTASLKVVRGLTVGAGPEATLSLPNPLESQLVPGFNLPGLLNSNRLDGAFIKIRVHETSDAANLLATPNADGSFSFPVTDSGYSQSLAYFSTNATLQYLENLGFQLDKTRPLVVLTNAKTDNDPKDPESANAFYSHNASSPNLPRIIQMIGETEYAPSKDRDMYWHEFGHFVNESVSADVGIDAAGDALARFTEGAALHECLADYLAQSLGNKPEIGRWIAKNFKDYSNNAPLRSALDSSNDVIDFSEVAINDGKGVTPGRYGMAEWCTRVLWEIREQWNEEDPDTGVIFADRMIFSSLALLQKDSSISNFRQALLESDKALHCGIHSRSIDASFRDHGFNDSPSSLDKPLRLSASPVGVSSNGAASEPTPGQEVTFTVKVTNPNSNTARNVRLSLENTHSALTPTTYMQGLGDLSPGQEIVIGGGNGLPYSASVFGSISSSVKSAKGISYRLRLLPENGPETIFDGVIGQ